MGTKKVVGIWMDHSIANLIDLETGKNYHNIEAVFDAEMKEEALQRSENIMNNKRQQMREEFYKEIGEETLKYDQVLLFGPTNAKVEMHNFLKDKPHYKNIQFEVQSADKMTDNEKVAFVKKLKKEGKMVYYKFNNNFVINLIDKAKVFLGGRDEKNN